MPALSSPRPRFTAGRAIFALVLREMSTAYGRTPGGYLWAFLQPIGAIAIMAFVFTFLLRKPPLGTSFALFYATGVLPLMMYQDLTNKIGTALRFSKPLLAYPTVSWMDALLARLILNVLTQGLVFIIVLAALVIGTGADVTLDFPKLMSGFAMLVVFSAGFGMVDCYLIGMVPLWPQIWAVLNRPLFIISGIFFVIDYLPETLRFYLLLNPVAHAIMELRAGFYPSYDAVYASPTYVFLVSGVLAFFGVLLLYRYHKKILDEGA
ncbi:ABC transporter permease [Pseudoroseicyclus aestuarii]|uniref:Transport permease protein n=1 Tax=Pseudoroseicyclus aestuarii TaxID=1795041 RepID=A0A318SZM7_9RHOB|nr:ABC transporter permease [Pseudoroseicyclus aestuarii]PYE82247.1 capsular polysaccharide transport system permease protein [Pseudoroseicyclus aestuarii]